MALGTRTFFALLPREVKELLKAYYHHASLDWRLNLSLAQLQAEEKAQALRTVVSVCRYYNGEPSPIEEETNRRHKQAWHYTWIDTKPGEAEIKVKVTNNTPRLNINPPPPMCWRDSPMVPWIEEPTEEQRVANLKAWKAAQYDLVAAKLRVTITAFDYDYPYLFERVCEWLLGVSTARGLYTN